MRSSDPKFKVIVCGWECEKTLERCIDSIRHQRYKNFETTCIIDASFDDGHRMAMGLWDLGKINRMFSSHPRKFLVENTVDAIEKSDANPNDIIVLVDADDWLFDGQALRTLSQYYTADPGLQLTYGTYVNYSTGKISKVCRPYGPKQNIRKAPWRASHLKTFRYSLFKQIPLDYLKHKGAFFKYSADRAFMIPMIELAGRTKIKFIPEILYVYNDKYPGNVHATHRKDQKKARDLINAKKPL